MSPSVDLDAINKDVGLPDESAREAALARQALLTKPAGALGQLEDLSVWLCGVQGTCPPKPLDRVSVVVFAADHGVAQSGVSAYPPEVTAQMVRNFVAGGAAVNVLARLAGATVRVLDVGVDVDWADGRGWSGPRRGHRIQGPAWQRRPLASARRLTRDEAEAGVLGRDGRRRRGDRCRRRPADPGRHGHRQHHLGRDADRDPHGHRRRLRGRPWHRDRRPRVDAQGRGRARLRPAWPPPRRGPHRTAGRVRRHGHRSHDRLHRAGRGAAYPRPARRCRLGARPPLWRNAFPSVRPGGTSRPTGRRNPPSATPSNACSSSPCWT